MQGLGWNVELDSFVEPNTIVGQVPFTNIIATLDPEAPRRLVLVSLHFYLKHLNV